ncbi:MAG: hypothetical protein AB1414_06905, partial [bacterium]
MGDEKVKKLNYKKLLALLLFSALLFLFSLPACAGTVTVTATNTAPIKIIDGDSDDLLKISIFNNTDISPVEWAKVDLKFTTNGTTPITGTEASNLFTQLWIAKDDGNGVFTDLTEDGPATSTTNFFSLGTSGILSIVFTDNDADLQITSGATKTFFLVLQLKQDASAQGTKTFVVTMDENGTQGTSSNLEFIVDDDGLSDNPLVLEQEGAELVSSSQCVAVPEDPTITVTDTAPTTLKDGSIDDILKIAVTHNSNSLAGNIEFAYLTMKFTSDGISLTGTTTPQALFQNIFVFRDGTPTGIGNYGSEDICVATVTQGSISLTSNGTMTIILPDPSSYTVTSWGPSTSTYFLVIELTQGASGWATRTFAVTVNAQAGDVVIEDETSDTRLGINSSGSGQSTQVKAIPKDPGVVGTNTAPVNIPDGSDDDLLKITITHTGTSSSGSIGFGTATFRFTKDGTTALSNQDASRLFAYFYIYRDTGDGSYSSSTDTRVATYTPSLDTNGEQTFVFGTSDTNIKTDGGTSTVYFLVVKLSGTASGYATDTFVASIISAKTFDWRDKFELATTFTPATSTQVKAIPIRPEVDVSNIAPVKICENDKDGLLKIKLINPGMAGAQEVKFASVTVRFGSQTDMQLTTGQAQALFKKLYIYYDEDGNGLFGASDVVVGSLTQSLISGTNTVELESSTRTTVSAGASATYLFVVELTGTASSVSPRLFMAKIKEDTDPVVRAGDTNEQLSMVTSDLGTSTQVTAVSPNPDVSATSTAPSPSTMSDLEKEDLLRLTLTHKGILGSQDIRLATVTVKLTSNGSSPLDTPQAKSLFDKIIIYYDTNGIFEEGDMVVGSVTNANISLDGGKQKIDLYNTAAETIVSVGSPKSYFVVVELRGTASDSAVRTFAATFEPATDTTVRDNLSNIILTINPTSSVTTAVITAQGTPTPPNVFVYDSAPTSITNGETNDLLMIKFGHTGDSKDANIEMVSLKVKFTNGTPTFTELTDTQAANLFQAVYVYLDSGNNNYDESDTQVGATTTIKGSTTFTFTDGDTNVQVPKSVGTKTYLLVVKLTANANDYGTFSATIDGSKVVAQDANTEGTLTIGGYNVGTSTSLKSASADPSIVVDSTGPGTTTIDPDFGRMFNDETNDLLRLEVRHSGIPATVGLVFATVTVQFTDGATALTTTQTKELFENIFIYLDTGDFEFGGTDTPVATITNAQIDLPGGIQKIDLPNNSSTQIGTGATKYYFLVIDLKATATLGAINTFNAIIDGDNCTLRRQDNLATHTISPTTPATSTPTTKIVMKNPTVDVDDTAPAPPTMTDGEQEDVLRIKVYHGETATILPNVRFATLTVTFLGGKTGATMTSTEAQNLFSNVWVYLDSGNDGSYSLSSDTIRVGTATTISGVTSIPVASSTNTVIAPAGSKTYFLVVQLRNDAVKASKQGTNSFVAVINSLYDPFIVEQDSGYRLTVSSPDSPVTSATVTAQGVVPTATVNVTNTVPSNPYNMPDSNIDDLLGVAITHNGTTTESSMWLSQMEVVFGSWTGALTTAQAKSLFKNIYIYLDTGDNQFQTTDTLVKTIPNAEISLSSLGTLSIAFTKVIETTIATNTTKTYFVVVELREDASGTSTHTFNATIDGDSQVILKDVNLEEGGTVTISTTSPVTSSDVRAVPKNPTVVISSSAPTSPPGIIDSQADDILRIQITHNGTITSGKIEFATLTVGFYRSNMTSMTNADVQNLFGTVSVYLDGDTIVKVATGTAILGTLTFTFDEISATRIEGGSSSIYYLVVELRGTASSYGTKTFVANVGSTTDVKVEAFSDDTNLTISLTPGSSTSVTALPKNPKVEVSTIAQAVLRDDGQPKNGLLAIKITNTGMSGAGKVEWATLTVRFTQSGGSALTGAQAEALFENLFVYLDDNRDGTYTVANDTTVVGSATDMTAFINTQGYGTFTFVEGTRTQIPSASSTTYFFVAELKPTASGASPKTFIGSITDQWVGMRDEQSNIGLSLDSASYGSSTPAVTIIPVDASATVTDTAKLMSNLQQKDTTKDDLLSISIGNNGTPGAGAVEFGTLGMRFYATGTTPLAQAEAEMLFENLFIYRDNGDGVYSTNTDTTAIATVTNMTTLLNAQGYGTIAITESTNSQIQSATSTTFFVVVELKNGASGQGTNTYFIEVGTANIGLRDAVSNIPVGLTSNSRGSVSTKVIAVPIDPTIQVTDTAPTRYTGAPPTMTDNEKEDLLRLRVIHNGVSTSRPIEFASLRVKFTQDQSLTTPLTNSQMGGLFRKVYVYYSADDDTYASQTDTIAIGSVTNFTGFLDSSGYGTITFPETGETKVSGNSSKYYFLVVELTGTASFQTPRTFVTTVDADVDAAIELATSTTRISVNPVATVSSTLITAQSIPATASITISNSAPSPPYIKDTNVDDLLSVVVTHTGDSLDAPIELATVTVLFTKDGTVSLTTAEAQGLISEVAIYYNGTRIGYTSITSNPQTINIFTGNSDPQITAGNSKTFFVFVSLQSTASGKGTRTFAVSSGQAGNTVVIQDANTQIALPGTYTQVATSTVITPIPVDPGVSITDCAPGSPGHPDPPTMTDGEKEDLLKLVVTHSGVSGAGTITFGTLSLRFFGTQSAGLTDSQVQSLVKTVYLFLDNGNNNYDNGGLDTDVGSQTGANVGSLTTVVLGTQNQNIQLAGAISRTYLVVVELTGTASQQATKTFGVKIDGDTDARIMDTRDSIPLSIIAVSTVSSTLVTAEKPLTGTSATVVVSDVPAPIYLKDGNTDDILRLKISHTGSSTEATLEFARLRVRFSNGAPTFTPMTTQEAQNLFDTIWVYRGTYTEGGVKIATVTSGSITLTNGIGTITFTDNDQNCWIEPGATATFFVVAKLNVNASGFATRTFALAVKVNNGGTGTDVCVEDANMDREVAIDSNPISATSTTTKAIPVDPSGTVTRVTIPYGSIKDRARDDILKIDITHNGTSTAEKVEFATVTVRFKRQDTLALLTNSDVQALFGTVSLYRDDEKDGSFSGDEIVGSATGSAVINPLILTLIKGTSTRVTGGSYSTYLLVVELTGTASGYSPKTVLACVNESGDIKIEDSRDDINLSMNLLPGTSNSLTAVPIDPLITATNTSPSIIKDEQKDDLISITIQNTGEVSAGKVEFATLTVWLGSNSTTALTTSQAQNLFNNIFVYYDSDSNGVYGTNTDIIAIGTITNAGLSSALNNGTLTIVLDTANQYSKVSAGSSNIYFLVFELKTTASTYTTKSFMVKFSPGSYTCVRDEASNIGLPIASASQGTQSGIVWAVPVDPSATVTSSSSVYQKDTSVDDLLKVVITNNGVVGAGKIRFATLTVRFGSEATTGFTDAQAQSLFEMVQVYWDSSNNGFSQAGDDYSVGEVSGSSVSGTTTIVLTDNSNAWINGGATKTFYLTVKLKPDASGTATRNFVAKVNAQAGEIKIEDVISDIGLPLIGSTDEATSTPTKALPVDPSATITTSAPATIKDLAEDDLLKMVITHNGVSTAGKIELATVTVSFYRSNMTYMSDVDAQSLFGTVSIYLDDNKDGVADDLVKTATGTDVLANLTFALPEGAYTQISGGTSSWYFLQVALKNNASGYEGTRTFIAAVNETSDVGIEDMREDIPLSFGFSPGTSSAVTAIPINPKVEVINVATDTSTLKDGTQTDLLKMIITHLGVVTAGKIEFSTLTVRFSEDGAGANAITTSEAQNLFGTISVYWDEENNGYGVGTDRLIGTQSPTNVSSTGFLTFVFTDGTDSTQIAGAGSKTYFLVVAIKPTASAGSVDTLVASITSSWVGIRDGTTNITLSLDATSYGSQSTSQSIIAVDPRVTVTDSTSSPWRLKDGAIDDLLKIEILNRGVSSAGQIEFATLTVVFGSQTGMVFNASQMNSLFGSVSVYYDSTKNGFAEGDTLIRMSSDFSGGTVTLSGFGETTRINAGTSNIYYLVVRLKPDASGTQTRNFKATIAPLNQGDVKIRDESTNIGLTLATGSTLVASSTVCTAIPINPIATISDTAYFLPPYPGTETDDFPRLMNESQREDLLKIDITNPGTLTAGKIEFGTVTVWFGSVTTTATGFTDDQAKALFEYIFIYRDDGDGTWTTTDTIIATVT